ncbi:transposase [Cutibacterium acnes]
MVTFAYKDYRDASAIKEMTLSKEEFVRRFLLHVLPSGFTKIRHYGILASKNLREKLKLCFKLIGIEFSPPESVKYVFECPHCGCAMKHLGTIMLNFGASPIMDFNDTYAFVFITDRK